MISNFVDSFDRTFSCTFCHTALNAPIIFLDETYHGLHEHCFDKVSHNPSLLDIQFVKGAIRFTGKGAIMPVLQELIVKVNQLRNRGLTPTSYSALFHAAITVGMFLLLLPF